MRTLTIALLLASGCLEYGVIKPDDGETPDPTEDTETETDIDTDEPGGECDDDFPDREADLDDDCLEGSEVSWELQLDWRWPDTDVGAIYELGAGAMRDVDGDGDVDTTDAKGIVVKAELLNHVLVEDQGAVVTEVLDDTYRSSLTLADVDPTRDGMELVGGWYYHHSEHDWAGLLDEHGVVWETAVPDGSWLRPWVADLDGDGLVEILVGSKVLAAEDGAVLATLEGVYPEALAVSADLDLDGTHEIVAVGSFGRATLHRPDGTLIVELQGALGSWVGGNVAIGDLDGDVEGEVVLAFGNQVSTYDHDGTLLARANVGAIQPALVGLGQLDRDPEPELLVADFDGLFALEHDLTPRWSRAVGAYQSYYPFALADLDADGRHEVVLHEEGWLRILDGDGAELASWAAPLSCCWICQPLVVDLDGDGHAELVVSGYPTLQVITNADRGWPAPGATTPWPATNHFPGDRLADGTVPAGADPHWTVPGSNVWQGLPAETDPAIGGAPELSVALDDVCMEEAGEAVVTAWVSNHGADLEGDITVTLTQQVGGEVLGTATLDGLPSGVAQAVVWTLAGDDVGLGLVVTIEADVEECNDEHLNQAAWSG